MSLASFQLWLTFCCLQAEAMVLCCGTKVLWYAAREDIDTGRMQVKMEAETGTMHLQAKPGERPETDSSSEPSKGTSPADTLIFFFLGGGGT